VEPRTSRVAEQANQHLAPLDRHLRNVASCERTLVACKELAADDTQAATYAEKWLDWAQQLPNVDESAQASLECLKTSTSAGLNHPRWRDVAAHAARASVKSRPDLVEWLRKHV